MLIVGTGRCVVLLLLLLLICSNQLMEIQLGLLFEQEHVNMGKIGATG